MLERLGKYEILETVAAGGQGTVYRARDGESGDVVAIRPKPAFRPIFEVATTRAGSGIVLINETPPDPEGPEAESLCSWRRRGSVQLYEER